MSRLSLGFAMMALWLLSATGASHAQRAMAHPMARATAAKPAQPAAARHTNAGPANGH